MTTYLATHRAITSPFCSERCRDEFVGDVTDQAFSDWTDTYRTDDRYEFDETCANCGALIPASAPYNASDLLEMLRADHAARHCPGCEICR